MKPRLLGIFTIIVTGFFACVNPDNHNDSEDRDPKGPKGIYNIEPGSSDYTNSFSAPVVYNSRLFFRGNNGSSDKIYEYDGWVIKNVKVDETSDYNNSFNSPVVYNHKLYFGGNSNSSESKIYQYDGTTITNMAADNFCDYLSDFSSPVLFNSCLYFTGFNGQQSTPYRFDGINFYHLMSGISDWSLGFTTPFDYANILFFDAYSSKQGIGEMGYYIYIDNTIRNMNSSCESQSDYYGGFASPIIFKDALYFRGKYAANSYTVFKYDQATLLWNVDKGVSDYKDQFSYPVIYNNRLYFNGTNGTDNKIYELNSIKMYELDITEIKNITIDPATSDYMKDFTDPIVYNNKLYFQGYSNSSYGKFYVYDGSSIKNVMDNGDSDYWGYYFITPLIFKGRLFFCGSCGGSTKVYEYNGSMIKNLITTDTDYEKNFDHAFIWDNAIFFEGSNGNIKKIYMIK